jgi:hypothetical protein
MIWYNKNNNQIYWKNNLVNHNWLIKNVKFGIIKIIKIKI